MSPIDPRSTVRSVALVLLLASASGQGEGAIVLLQEDLAGTVVRVPLAEGTPVDLTSESAVFLRFAGLPAPAAFQVSAEDRAELELAWGQRLSGRLRGGQGEDLLIEVAPEIVVNVPLDEMRSLVVPARTVVEGGLERVAPPSGDRLYRRRGGGVDRIDGLVQGLAAEGLDFESDLGARRYPWDEVAALFVEALEDEPRPAAGFAVDLFGGSRLRGDVLRVGPQSVSMRWGALGREIELPSSLVLEIAREDGRWTSLSELGPSDLGPLSSFGDEFGKVWPPRMDRAQSGGPLRAEGREWARGIGVHACSRITWDLAGGYSSLRLYAAIDDEVRRADRGGSVQFLIRVDDTVYFVDTEGKLASLKFSGELSCPDLPIPEAKIRIAHAGEPPLEIGPIDLTGARELVLAVYPGPDSFVLDRADWLRPILLRR